MIKLLNEQICVILINNFNRHYCFYINCMIWVYDNCFNNVVTSISGGDNGNMAMLPWLPFHNRLMKMSYVWRSTTKMIDLNVYNTCVFVFRKKKKLWVQSHYILNSPRIDRRIPDWMISHTYFFNAMYNRPNIFTDYTMFLFS